MKKGVPGPNLFRRPPPPLYFFNHSAEFLTIVPPALLRWNVLSLFLPKSGLIYTQSVQRPVFGYTAKTKEHCTATSRGKFLFQLHGLLLVLGWVHSLSLWLVRIMMLTPMATCFRTCTVKTSGIRIQQVFKGELSWFRIKQLSFCKKICIDEHALSVGKQPFSKFLV